MAETWAEMTKRHEIERLSLVRDHMHLSVLRASKNLGISSSSLWSFLSYRGLSWSKAKLEAAYPELKEVTSSHD